MSSRTSNNNSTARFSFGLLACLTTLPSLAAAANLPIDTHQTDANQSKEAFIANLMKQMTLEEKIGQLRLVSVGPEYIREAINKDIEKGNVGAIFNTVVRPQIRRFQEEAVQRSRLKIPLFFAYDVVHGHRTVFPISLGLAASWDMQAIATSARVSAEEASADGLDMTFAPMVDITRDPRWGRVSEGFGEDTYLVSRIAKVMVDGYQNHDLTNPTSIMAGVKHFAMYGAPEGGREYNTADMSPQRMYQDYLPPYRAAVEAGAGAVMVSLNSINGMPATANKWLLKDLLRTDWGFKGVTLSDHGAIKELIKHGVAGDGKDAVRVAINAGIDSSMNDTLYDKNVPDLLKSGAIAQADVDRAVHNVLATKYDMGLFADPFRRVGKIADDPVDTDAENRLHREAARDVARRSMVLLKNDAQVLPLKKQGKIAVIGPLAKSQRDVIGSWSAAGKPRQAVSVYQGLDNALGNQAQLLYAKGANISNDQDYIDFLNLYSTEVEIDTRPTSQMLNEAVDVAKQADVIVAVVGESQGMAHEASSRTDITVPESQRMLLKALKATGKPLVLVLMNGRPLALSWENQNADALLETWFSGTEGGNAIADVLFGDYNPSGKLSMTFPRSVGQVPIYYNHLNTGRPLDPEHPDKYTSRYSDSPNGPLFPFGYGLSYTDFNVSDITLSSDKMTADGQIKASVTVTNTGKRAGETVVQLYLRDVVGTLSRPVKELKNFRKLALKPGEKQVVEFTLSNEDLKFYNYQLHYGSEPGDFKVFIGLDSDNVHEANFKLL